MANIRRLGILTSGGDCAGLNAVIRGVVQHGTDTYGAQVVGIRNGHHGLLADDPDILDLSPTAFDGDLLREGGTFLGASTSADPRHPDPEEEAAAVQAAVGKLDLDALVVVGGDGSMRAFDRLLSDAVPWVGVPKTIDNDVPGTDFSVGFFTAVEVAGDALDRLQSTAASHRRVMVLETMGRQSGFIALFGGVAGGADAILLPELVNDPDALATHVNRVRAEEHAHVLIAVAEGVDVPSIEASDGSIGMAVATDLTVRTGVAARCTVLGHLQRGGSPAVFDRLLASVFSVRAVDILMQGGTRRLTAWRGGVVTDIPMDEAVAGPRLVDPDGDMMKTARGLGIYLGR